MKSIPNFEFIDKLNVDQHSKQKLSLNLSNIVQGSDEVYTTPFVGDTDGKSFLEGWDKIFNSNEHKMNKVLLDLENSNRTKYGPRSLQKPWAERRDSVRDYYQAETSQLSPALHFAEKKGLRSNLLRPVELQTAAKKLKSSTSSGMPFMLKKGFVRDKVVSQFDKLLSRKDPCVLFTRTQEANKTRNIWGFPIADTLNEMRFYLPLLEYQKSRDWRAAINGPDVVSARITDMINFAVSSNSTLVSIDFSAYDASVKKGITGNIIPIC